MCVCVLNFISLQCSKAEIQTPSLKLKTFAAGYKITQA